MKWYRSWKEAMTETEILNLIALHARAEDAVNSPSSPYYVPLDISLAETRWRKRQAVWELMNDPALMEQ